MAEPVQRSQRRSLKLFATCCVVCLATAALLLFVAQSFLVEAIFIGVMIVSGGLSSLLKASSTVRYLEYSAMAGAFLALMYGLYS